MRRAVFSFFLNGAAAVSSAGWAIYWSLKLSRPELVLINIAATAINTWMVHAVYGQAIRERRALRELRARDYLAQERERLLIERSTVEELAEIYGRRGSSGG